MAVRGLTEQIRSAAREKFVKVLTDPAALMGPSPKPDAAAIAAGAKIEQSCLNKAILADKSSIVLVYQIETCRLFANLTMFGTDSEALRAAALAVPGVAENMAQRSNEDLCPTPTAALRAKIEKQRGQKLQIKVSTAHQCHRCKARRTSVKDYMGASADEVSKFSIYCLECGNQWHI